MTLSDERTEPCIASETQLRKTISGYPKILDKRIQPELDRYCLELIEVSTLIISAFSLVDCLMMPLTKQNVIIADSKTIVLSHDVALISQGEEFYASLYFLVPGVGHGLRVNGQIRQDGSQLVLSVRSAYLHCARAAARAGLWGSKVKISNIIDSQMSPEQFISMSPYLLMKTMNEVGETEISPRGDQSGFVFFIDQYRLFIPERPGNKVAVSLRKDF